MTPLTNFLGDIHANASLLQNIPTNTIQIGDLNLFGYDKWYENGRLVSWKFEHPMWFIDGNHDMFEKFDPNAAEIKKIRHNLFYIPRGFVSGKVLFIGGAESIDAHMRTLGRDLFAEETLSQAQFHRIMQITQPIEVVVSHEAPQSIISQVKHVYHSPTQIALDTIFEHFRPKLWIFGHHHMSIDTSFKDCHFVGLDIGEQRRFDIPLAQNFFTKKVNSHDA